MAKYIRTQVFLEEKQREHLIEIARNAGISFSELVRDFLDAQIRIRSYKDIRHAAEQLCDDYAHGGILTGMTALDGEDFINV